MTGTDGKSYAYILHNTVNVDISTATYSPLRWIDGVSTVTLHDIVYDSAGHVIGDHPFDFVLPSGINGDNWINISTDTESNVINLSHTTVGSLSGGDDTARTVTFGGSFNAVNISTDSAGHVISLSTTAITLPAITFDGATAGDGSSAITGLTFDNVTGTFTIVRTPIATLTLSSLNTSTTTATSSIEETDSLADALKKLENRIAAEESSRVSAIEGLDSTITISDINSVITATIDQADGKLNQDESSLAIN